MRERDRLLVRLGAAVDKADRRDVVHATADLILNVIRQKHPNLRDAQVELAEIARWMACDLPTHYDAAGRRKETRIILPPMRDLIGLPN